MDWGFFVGKKIFKVFKTLKVWTRREKMKLTGKSVSLGENNFIVLRLKYV
jgi:hypothetical protein